MTILSFKQYLDEAKAMKKVDRSGLNSGWLSHHGKYHAAPRSHHRTVTRLLKKKFHDIDAGDDAIRHKGWSRVVRDVKDGGGYAEFDSRSTKLKHGDHVAMIRRKFGKDFQVHDHARPVHETKDFPKRKGTGLVKKHFGMRIVYLRGTPGEKYPKANYYKDKNGL